MNFRERESDVAQNTEQGGEALTGNQNHGVLKNGNGWKNVAKAVALSGVIALTPQMAEAKTVATPKSDSVVWNVSERCQAIMYDSNALCVNRQHDGKFYVTHFKKGEEVGTWLTSPGKPQKDGGAWTPEGTFSIDRKHRRQPTNYGGHLPYASHLYKGIYFHRGTTNGNILSHGCLRLRDEVAQYIYYNIPKGTKVAIDGIHSVRYKK